MRPDRVTDAEIDAYLDGELDLQRRLDVEDHLAHTPDAAAQAMADLRNRTALRLAQDGAGAPPLALVEAANKLSQRLTSRRSILSAFSTSRLTAASALSVALIAGAVLVSTSAFARTPSYVADAVMAYQTGILRAAMPSQIESRVLDLGEIRRTTRIRVPSLPEGWRVTDVQIFPSDEGPALQIMVRTVDGEDVSIFAVRSASSAPNSPVAVRKGSTSVAYWRAGDMSYALTGVEAPEALDLAAEDLADNQSS